MPGLSGRIVRKNVAGKRRCPQHIEIVHFAQQILHMLQIVAPGFVLFREKILDDIAKALNPDAKCVQRNLRAIAA